MNTPICGFVQNYAAGGAMRFHMPGHKGRARLGPEPLDITEIAGADVLYAPESIIRESEENAALLFGSAAEGEIFFSIIDDKTRYVYGFSFRNDKFGIITKDSLEEARTMQDTEPHDDLEYVYCECTPVDIKEPGKTYVAMCDYYA